MGGYTALQSLVTVTGDTTDATVVEIQPMDGWLEMLNYADVIITLHVKNISLTGSDTADIALATTDAKRAGSFDAVPDGPRWDIWTESSVAADNWYKKALTLERMGEIDQVRQDG